MQAEKALVRLSKRASNDAATAVNGGTPGGAAASAGAGTEADASGNPFLAAPTWEAASAEAAAAGAAAAAELTHPVVAASPTEANKLGSDLSGCLNTPASLYLHFTCISLWHPHYTCHALLELEFAVGPQNIHSVAESHIGMMC